MTLSRDLYQEVLLDHHKNPRNRRALESPDRRADGDNPLCGDRVTVYLNLEASDDGDGADRPGEDRSRLAEVTFEGVGCAISQASASAMTQAVRGRSVEEVHRLAESFRAMVTGRKKAGSNATGDGSGEPGEAFAEGGLEELTAFSGVSAYPMRVKCATLPWHTLEAALASGGPTEEPVSTEV